MSSDKSITPANPAPAPLPAAQDAGQIPVTSEDVQTRPPQVQPPLTSATGTGFNAPDAGTGMPQQRVDTANDDPSRPQQATTGTL